MIASPANRRLPIVLASASIFTLMQWTVSSCRFRTGNYFSPVNIALVLLLVKSVIAPILVMAVGATNDLFVAVSSRESMQGAVLIDVIAYVALCLGLALARPNSPALKVLGVSPGTGAIVIFAGLGLLGFFLAFGSPGKIVEYFQNPASLQEMQRENEGSWSGFLATVLRPFLAFALIAWWTRSIDKTRPSWRLILSGVVAAAGVTLANATFSFNRAAFVFPLLALAAVYNARSRRLSPLVIAAVLAVLLPLLFAIGNYRAEKLAPPTAPQAHGTWETSLREASDTIQAYSGGPPLAGVFLERTNWGAHPYLGSTLVASALAPAPILGKGFRESSGSALYNQVLYGVPGYEDQIIPFSSELFVNFHAIGVIAGFFVLGQVLARAEGWFATVESAFGAFTIQYVFMWCAMLSAWSLSIFSQITIYFLWPVYLYCAAACARAWLRGMRVPKLANSFF